MLSVWRRVRSQVRQWSWALMVLSTWPACSLAGEGPGEGLSTSLTVAEQDSAATGKGLSLEELIEQAVRNHPDVAIAQARLDAARGRLIQAGLYPNPTLTWEAEEMNHTGDSAGNQGPVFAQEIITRRKRRIAQAAARHGITVADWQAVSRYFEVVTRARTTYFELLTARQEVQTAEEIVGLARDNLAAAQKLLKAGTGVQPDVLRAQVELDQDTVQLNVLQQRLTAAGQLVAAAAGLPRLDPASVDGAFPARVPDYSWQPALAAVLSRSSLVQEAQAAVLQAEELYRLAQAEKCPNLRLSVRPFYAFPDQRMETTVQFGTGLPIFNRNQGNIVAADAEVFRTREEVRRIELQLQEQLAGAFQRYQSARRQTETYQKQILPNARKSLDLIRIGYEKGDPKYDYTALLQAQRTLTEARLVYVRALGGLWRAISEIAGLLQQDGLAGN